MTRHTVSAPGKIVLSGEYAVLYGASAIAAAVDRRARVMLETIDSPYIEVAAPGYRSGLFRYQALPDGGLVPVDTPPDPRSFDLFELTWAACRPAVKGGLSVTLDTREFIDGGRKLGLGSSAALCVALTAAMLPDSHADSIARRAQAVHQEFQGGGSGVDIACSRHGGILCYQRKNAHSSPLHLPRDLHVAVLWSGQPASTAERIETLSDGLQDGEGHATLDVLVDESNALATCWQNGNTRELLQRYSGYNDALRAFDDDHNLDIYGAGHAELGEAARAAGLIYKPCGAGGGDVGVALSSSPEQLAMFKTRAADFGFEALDLTLGAAGLRHDE